MSGRQRVDALKQRRQAYRDMILPGHRAIVGLVFEHTDDEEERIRLLAEHLATDASDVAWTIHELEVRLAKYEPTLADLRSPDERYEDE